MSIHEDLHRAANQVLKNITSLKAVPTVGALSNLTLWGFREEAFVRCDGHEGDFGPKATSCATDSFGMLPFCCSMM